MQNPPSSAETKPIVVLVIYAAFLAAGFAYLGIFLSGVMPAPEAGGDSRTPNLGIILYLFSAMALAGGLVPSRFLKSTQNPDGPGIRITRMIVRLACFEGIGINGLIGSFLGLSRAESIGFILFSLALLLASGIWVPALYQSLSRPAEGHQYRR